ncbi:SpvB/TcaC N-terminal domain-containing protein [Pseudoalteromonas aurantia]|uniref:SpvB/TcaC N-terminal domain-containing protein n=1 Tax=Pseudoalteromonas aurantia TaxID=43654 RepID=UPI0014874180|nr:SpvB/TcaC N-terminal domain-containing protein [Pseudoalteromonas aurantia]
MLRVLLLILGVFMLFGQKVLAAQVPSAPTISGPAYHEYRGTYSYSWNNPGGSVSSYKVEKSWKPDRTGSASVSTVTYSSTGYSETFTEPGTYVAKVRACNSAGCSGWSNYEVNIIRPHWKPNQTVANGPSSSSTGRFQLTWSKPWGHGINNYIVERAANGGGFGQVQSGASMSLNQSLSNGTYTYRINVCNEDNVCSGFGPTRQVVVDIPPPPPSTPSEPDVAWDLYHPQGGSIRVHVPSISGATSYTIYNDTSTSGRAQSRNVGTGWTTIPAVGVGYNYIRIVACNRSGCSESVPRRVVIFSAPHSVSPSINKSIANKNDSVTISWGLPAGTIWSGAYFKVHCRTRAHGDVCNQTIPYQGSSNQTSFSHSFTVSHVAGYDIQVLSCNESDSHCSSGGTGTVHVLPQVHGHPKFNLSHDFYYPINTDIPLILASGIDGADSFAASVNGSIVKYLPASGMGAIQIDTIGEHQLNMRACVTAPSGHRQCSAPSVSQKISLFNHKPTAVTVELSNNTPDLSQATTLKWRAPSDMIWEKSYFKVHCLNPAGVDFCNNTINYRGDMPADFSQSLTFNQHGAYSISVKACNKTTAYCSTSNILQANLLPAVPGDPGYNIGWVVNYPLNSEIKVAIPQEIAGAESFAIYYYQRNSSPIKIAQVPVTQSTYTIKANKLGKYTLQLASCVGVANPVCSAPSMKRGIDVYTTPEPVTGKFSTEKVSVGPNSALELTIPAGTLWDKAYFKVTCFSPSGAQVCSEKVAYRGDMPKPFKVNLEFKEVGVHSVKLQVCNETDAYCSAVTTMSVDVLPMVPVKPEGNVKGDFYYPENGIMRVYLPENVAGATSFQVFYGKGEELTFNKNVSVSQGYVDVPVGAEGVHLLSLASCITGSTGAKKCSEQSETQNIIVYVAPHPVLPKLSKSQVRTSEKVTLTWTQPAGTIYESAVYKVACTLEGDPNNHCLPEGPIRQIGQKAAHSYEFRLTKPGDYKIRVQSCNDAQHCSAQGYVVLKVIQSDIPIPVIEAPARTFLNAKERVKWSFATPPKTPFDTTLFVKTPSSTEPDKLASQPQNKAGEYTYSFNTAGTYRFYAQACGVAEDLKKVVPITMNDIFIPVVMNSGSSSVCSELEASEVTVEVINKEFLFKQSGNKFSWDKLDNVASFEIESAICNGICDDLSALNWGVIATLNSSDTSYNITPAEGEVYRITVRFSDGSYATIYAVDASPTGYAQTSSNTLTDATLTAITAPTAANVGTLAGNAGVNGGAASYSLPIQIAPGRNGVQPKISLNYSSRSGNGIAGMGFSLSAGSQISRCAATYAQDGFTQNPQYNDNDKLCLDGQRLISVDGVYGQEGTVYRTEIESFVRVTQSGGFNSASTSFTVEYPNGTVAKYGHDDTSRVIHSNNSAAYTWLISHQHDATEKNYIHYDYTDYGAGETLLTNIAYTGSSATDKGQQAIKFEYTGRSVPRSGYIAGGYYEQTKRLSSVKVYTNNTLVHRYALGYVSSLNSGRDLLNSVTQCFSLSGTCLPTTTFSWANKKNTYAIEPFSVDGLQLFPDPYSLNGVLPRGDKNGDGARDWPGYFINAEGGNEGQNPNELSPCFVNIYTTGLSCIDADFNGDGKTDDFSITSNRYLELTYTDGKSITTPVYMPKEQRRGVGLDHSHIKTAADFDGDSFIDLLVYEAGDLNINPTLKLYLHSGDFTAPYSAGKLIYTYLTESLGGGSYTLRKGIEVMGDLTGDGSIDLIETDFGVRLRVPYVQPRPINIYSNNGNGTFSVNALNFRLSNELENPDSYHYFDINGDGLQDWLVQKSSNLTVKFNKGDGTFSDEATIHSDEHLFAGRTIYIPGHSEPDGNGGFHNETRWVNKYQGGFKIHDLNNDGVPELLMPGERVYSSCMRLFDDGVYGNKCGEQLYGHYKARTDSDKLTSIDSQRVDKSIYQFDALHFSFDANGTLKVEKKPTDLYGPAYDSQFVDAFGNGLSSFMYNHQPIRDGVSYEGSATGTPFAGFEDSFGVNLNRNYGSGSGNTGSDYAPSDMLTSVTNGVGHQSGWAYRPLSTGLDTPIAGAKNLYEKGTDYTQGYQNFASSMYVVTTFSQDDGVGAKRYKDYAYRGAVQNTQGRGFMGFERIIEQDRSLGVVSQSDFAQVFPRSGKLVRQASFLAADFGSRTAGKLAGELTESTAITFNEYEWLINPNHSVTDVTQVYLGSKTKIQRDINDKTEVTRTDYTAVDIDACGNVTNSSNIIQDSWGTYQTTSSSTVATDASCANTGTWWPNKLDSTAVTKAAVSNRHASDPLTDNTLDKTSTIKSTFTEYATNRKPANVKVEGFEGEAASGEGRTTTTVFNIYGLPTSVTKTANIRNSTGQWVAQARPVTMTYSKEGKTAAADGYFPLTVTNAKGHQVITHVDPGTGQPTQTKQQVGASAWLTSTIQYDNVNRPYSSKVDGAPIHYTSVQSVEGDSHSPSNAVMMIKQLSAGSPESRIYQDKLGRTLRVATQSFDGTWVYQDTTYDGLGRKTFESMPYQANGTAVGTTYSGFDVLGRPTTKTVAQQCTSTSTGLMTVTYGYSGLDTTIDVTENCLGLSLGQMSRTYNSLKQLVATKDALNGWTYYGYNSLGLPAVIQDANGNQIKATYNALGHKTSVNDPNQGASTFAYNGFGELQAEGRPDNVTLTFLTDTLGRVTKRTATGESDLHYGFDAGNGYGQMTSSSGNGVSHSYVFDGYGRPTTHTVSGDGKSYTNTTFYDGNYGRVKGVRYPNDLTLEYTYNSLGYQESIKNAANDYVYQTVESQDILGNITQHALGNGLAQTTLYSAANGQMTSVTTKDGNDQVMSLQYTGYDGFGNLNAMTVSTGSIGNQHTFSESYVYDDLHRLKSNSVNGIETIHYTYDALGNLTKKSDYASEYKYDTWLSGFSGGGSNAVKQVYKNGTWVGFSYDKRGNMIKGDGLSSATYNAMDKPISLTKHGVTTEFMYGPDHMRYKQTKGSSTFTYYAGGYEEDVKNGKTTWRAYIGDVAVVSQGEGESATIRYTHRDRLGSARLFTDKNGNVLAERNFDPFGKPKEASGEQKLPAMLGDMDTATTMRGFTDHEHLDGQQLIHMNGRVYDYNLGRFMSVDPVIQSPGDSQSINPYSYIMNNPLAGTDPTGYSIEEETVDFDVADIENIEVYADGSITVNFSNGAESQSFSNAKVSLGGATVDIGSMAATAKRDALIAGDVYESKSKLSKAENGIERLSNQKLKEKGLDDLTYQDEDSGFNSALYFDYEREMYIYAFAGTSITNVTGDWKTNYLQSEGENSVQYDFAVNNTRRITMRLGSSNVSTTGHSLGGGLASVSASAFGLKSNTFNAAGIHDKTISNYNINQQHFLNVNAYYVKGEVLSYYQDTRAGLPSAIGNRVELKPNNFKYDYPNVSTRTQRHLMSSVHRALDRTYP